MAWQVVDEFGEVVIPAETIAEAARLERKTPRQVARREAKNLVNPEAGDAPVYAINPEKAWR